MGDIAREAGVSRSAVSRALQGRDRLVRAEIRERILAVAQRLGYRPDPMVSALMAQRRSGKRSDEALGTIAVVSIWPAGQSSWFDQSFYRPYHGGIVERTRALGYECEAFRCDGTNVSSRRLLRTLHARGIQGLIIPQAHESITELPFEVGSFAVAYIGIGIRSPHLSRVEAALEYNMRLTWRNAIAAGYQRIAFVTWKTLTTKNAGAWVGPFLFLQRELPSSNRLAPLELPEHDAEPAIEWIRRRRPDAVISEDEGFLQQIREQFPDLGYFACAWQGARTLSGVDTRRESIGAAAVDLVAAQLARGERGIPALPKLVQIEGVWHEAAGADT